MGQVWGKSTFLSTLITADGRQWSKCRVAQTKAAFNKIKNILYICVNWGEEALRNYIDNSNAWKNHGQPAD